MDTTMTKEQKYLTTIEAARYLGITRAGVKHHIDAGNLPGAYKGRARRGIRQVWYIPKAALDKLRNS